MSEFIYWLRRMWLKRQIAMHEQRLLEFVSMVERERAMTEHFVGVLNERLRELQTRRLHKRLGAV